MFSFPEAYVDPEICKNVLEVQRWTPDMCVMLNTMTFILDIFHTFDGLQKHWSKNRIMSKPKFLLW